MVQEDLEIPRRDLEIIVKRVNKGSVVNIKLLHASLNTEKVSRNQPREDKEKEILKLKKELTLLTEKLALSQKEDRDDQGDEDKTERPPHLRPSRPPRISEGD